MKTILITGANGNLGSATVRKFLDQGYRVIAVDSSSSHLEFAKGNPDFSLHAVNLTREQETADFISTLIQTYGRIDAGLLLVGGFAAGNIEATKGSDLGSMYTLNFETAYFTCRPLLQHMKVNGYGRLVFVGARPALVASQGKDLVAYSLSKSLLFKLSELINEETKGTNVTASVIVPSTIDTIINRKSMPDANPADWVKPEQLADILEMICSDQGDPLRQSILKVYNNS